MDPAQNKTQLEDVEKTLFQAKKKPPPLNLNLFFSEINLDGDHKPLSDRSISESPSVLRRKFLAYFALENENISQSTQKTT